LVVLLLRAPPQMSPTTRRAARANAASATPTHAATPVAPRSPRRDDADDDAEVRGRLRARIGAATRLTRDASARPAFVPS
jgi:hypothetical protein